MLALCFDTETTGLVDNRTLRLEKQAEIIEFYAALVNLQTGEILEELDTLIKPKNKIYAKITGITGITNGMVADALPFAAHAQRIKSIIERAPLVIAHNLSFDKDIVDIEFERMDGKVQWPDGLCTVEQTEYIRGFRMSLGMLYEHLFGEKFLGAHRAKVDVAAHIRCCVELHRRGML